MARTLAVNTKSFAIYNAIRAKRKTGITVQDLSEATGIKVPHMGSYLAELKRVYGADVQYDVKKKRYMIKNLKSVRQAFEERFAPKKATATVSAPIAEVAEEVAED